MPTARLGITAQVRLPQVTLETRERVERLVQKAALDIEAHAKGRAPVDTGFLRSSITADQVGPLHHRVVAYAHYAIYVEFGTRHMAAQPFMRPAAELVRANLEGALRMVVV